MRNKPTLVLIEMAILFLVFAIAAVLCLGAFFWAKETSEESFARDQALVQAQSAAETVKACRGDLEAAAELLGGFPEGEDRILCQGDFTDGEKVRSYTLTVTMLEGEPETLGQAEVCVMQDGKELIRLHTAWQEVVGHE